jgi:hypothetical protein
MRNLNLSCFKPHSIQNLDSGMAVSLFDAGIFFSYCINSFRKRDEIIPFQFYYSLLL